MSPNQLVEICRAFNLGNPIGRPERVYGGLLHLMWKVNTDNGTYAIKQLSQDIDLKDEGVRKNYELTERIALRFSKQGVTAINSIEKEGAHLIEAGKNSFLIYPWVEVYAFYKDLVSKPHALKIFKIIAKMHKIKI